MTIEENEVMLPTNDYVFKKIFGQIGREQRPFISSQAGTWLLLGNCWVEP